MVEDRNKRKRKRHTKEYYLRAKVEFIDFLANPAEERSQGDFAKGGDVSEQTLSDWKRERGFWNTVWERFTSFYLQGQLPAINRRLVQKAKGGDRYAMDKVYELAGRTAGAGIEQKPLPEVEDWLVDAFNEAVERRLMGNSVPRFGKFGGNEAPNAGDNEPQDSPPEV